MDKKIFRPKTVSEIANDILSLPDNISFYRFLGIIEYQIVHDNELNLKIFKELLKGINIKNDTGNRAIRLACEVGRVEVVKLLVEAGADFTCDNNYPFRVACLNGRLDLAKFLLDAGVSMDEIGGRVLVQACRSSMDFRIVNFLLKHGADVHYREDLALREAIDHEDLELIKILINAGADVHALDDFAIRHASWLGNTRIVDTLIKAGSNIHAKNSEPLENACLRGSVSVIKLLLKNGAKPEDVNDGKIIQEIREIQKEMEMNESILRPKSNDELVKILKDLDQRSLHDRFLYSCKTNDINMINLIINAGYDVRSNENEAIIKSCYNGMYDVVKILLEHGADVNAKNGVPLENASAAGYTNIVKLLLQYGANIHANAEGALRAACAAEHLHIIELLLDNAAEINTGDVILRNAAINGSAQVTQLLIDKGINIHENGDEALIWACRKNNYDIVKILLDNGANIHTAEDKPLRDAVARGNIDTVEVLLSYGADPNAKNGEAFRTASELANKSYVNNIYREIYKLLGRVVAKRLTESVLRPKSTSEILHDADPLEALLEASRLGFIDVVKELIKRGINISINNDYALRAACKYGQTGIVELLLNNGANIEAKNGEPLWYACFFKKYSTIELLLQRGATVTQDLIHEMVERDDKVAEMLKKYFYGNNK